MFATSDPAILYSLLALPPVEYPLYELDLTFHVGCAMGTQMGTQ
jgi:hypothetical protein